MVGGNPLGLAKVASQVTARNAPVTGLGFGSYSRLSGAVHESVAHHMQILTQQWTTQTLAIKPSLSYKVSNGTVQIGRLVNLASCLVVEEQLLRY